MTGPNVVYTDDEITSKVGPPPICCDVNHSVKSEVLLPIYPRFSSPSSGIVLFVLAEWEQKTHHGVSLLCLLSFTLEVDLFPRRRQMTANPCMQTCR